MQYLPTEWFLWIIVYSLYLSIPVYFYICITFKYIFVYLKKKTIPGINIYTYIVLCIYLSHFAKLLSKFVSLVQASLAAASLVAANTSCQRLPGCLRSILQLHMQLLAANKLAPCICFFCLLVVFFSSAMWISHCTSEESCMESHYTTLKWWRLVGLVQGNVRAKSSMLH